MAQFTCTDIRYGTHGLVFISDSREQAMADMKPTFEGMAAAEQPQSQNETDIERQAYIDKRVAEMGEEYCLALEEVYA